MSCLTVHRPHSSCSSPTAGWLALLVVLPLCACTPGDDPRRPRHQGDRPGVAGRVGGLKGCGPIGAKGCCSFSTLQYCSNGYPVAVSCAATPKCGWSSAAGKYACGTSGAADPSGKHPISCMAYAPDYTIPPTDFPQYDMGSKTDIGTPSDKGSKADTGAQADTATLTDTGTNTDKAGKADKGKADTGTPPDAAAPDIAPDVGAPVCGDGKCAKPAEDCQTCPADCGKCTGCEARVTPKCTNCKCETCVCKLDPWCCNNKWDSVCVNKCKMNPCTGCGVVSVPEAGLPDGPQCGDGNCTMPQEDCQTCPADCGKCTGCEVRQTPKCSGCACEACVCTQDPDCCKYGWDSLCADRCKNTCGGCKVKAVDAAVPDLLLAKDQSLVPDKAPPPADLPKPQDLPIVSDKAAPPDKPGPKDLPPPPPDKAAPPDLPGPKDLPPPPSDKTPPSDLPGPKDLPPPPSDKAAPSDLPKPADQPKPPDKATPADLPQPPDKPAAPDLPKPPDQGKVPDQPKTTIDLVVLPDQLESVDTKPQAELSPGDLTMAGEDVSPDATLADRSMDTPMPDRHRTPASDLVAEGGQPGDPDEEGCSCRAGRRGTADGLWVMALLILAVICRRGWS